MADESRPRRAGAFDIRSIIAFLIGVYGIVITIMGIGFTTDEEVSRAAGVNINLWAGIGMLVVAAAFLLWAKLRPLKVPENPESAEDAADSGASGH